jgi:DnaK suppressor protein
MEKNKMDYSEIKSKLIAEREALFDKVSKVEEIDHDGDETDEIQANLISQISKHLGTRDVEKLAQINIVLSKIADLTYGICEDCGEPISEKRLLINACFQTCIGCAESREFEKRQYRQGK